MARWRHCYAFLAKRFDRCQRVTVIALCSFNRHRGFDFSLHLFFVAFNAAQRGRLHFFGFAVFQVKVFQRHRCLCRRVAGQAIGHGFANRVKVRFVAERQRRFHARLCRIQFGIDDLPSEPMNSKLRTCDRAIVFQWFGRVRVAAGAIGGKSIFRIRLFGFGRRNDFWVKVANKTFWMSWRAHLHTVGEIDFGDCDRRCVRGVTSRAFEFVFIQTLVGFWVGGFGVEEFDLLFQRSLRRVLIVIIHVTAVRKVIVKL